MKTSVCSRAAVVCAVTAWALLFAGVAMAADQTEYLRKAPSVLADPGRYVDISSGVLTYDKARALMRLAFPDEDVNDPEFYCMVHVLVWGDEAGTVSKSHWYTYRGRGGRASYGGRWSPARFTESRVLGTDRLGLLYVHLNVPAETHQKAVNQLTPKIAAGLVNPAGGSYTLDELLPAAGPKEALTSIREKPLREIGGFILESAYASITYQIDIMKKLPAPVQNLQDALGLLEGAAATGPTVDLTDRVALYAGDIYDVLHVPSDVTATGKLKTGNTALDQTVELGKQTFDNEGLYYWDVSLGIPLRSVSQLDFQASGGQVFAKEVDKKDLMGLLNVFWRPRDTKNTRFYVTPTPIVGLALGRKPLDKVLIGGSIGLNRVQFFAGWQWSRIDKVPVPAAGSQSPTEDTTEYKQGLVTGINVPVRQVVEFLKGKK